MNINGMPSRPTAFALIDRSGIRHVQLQELKQYEKKKKSEFKLRHGVPGPRESTTILDE
jgi:hypothetical protein